MNRIRTVLLLVFIGLAIPVSILVARALDGIEHEEHSRKRVIAARIFDEMERELSAYLASEEAQPIEAYGYYLDSGGDIRSPLSFVADIPFVIAHFEVDRTGLVHTTLVPRSDDALGTPPDDAETLTRVERTLRHVEPAFRQAIDRRNATSPTEMDDLDADGEAIAATAHGDRIAAKVQRKDEASGRDAGYELLNKLNIGSESRRERKQTVHVARRDTIAKRGDAQGGDVWGDDVWGDDVEGIDEPRAEAQGEQLSYSPSTSFRTFADAAEAPEAGTLEILEEEAAVPPRRPAPRPADSAPQSPSRASAPPSDTARSTDADSKYGSYAGNPEPARLPARSPLAATLPPQTVQVLLDPMSGHAIGADLLMLYRTVVVGDLGLRQGVLIDRIRLETWLRETVLERLGPTAEIAISFAPATESAANGDRFGHAFAPPFQALSAHVDLPARPASGGALTLYALAVLLAVVALIGLLAVERMTSFALTFAERRSNFVAAVTHELRTPLTAIRMHAEMLRDGLVSGDDTRHRYHVTITQESERLSRLIDNVLEFSRLEKGTRQFDLRAGDLGDCVRELAEQLAQPIASTGFTLRVEVEPDLPAVRFDRDAIVQMLFNLVDNAVKYASEAETREIVLSCEHTQGGGVALVVRDFGPGIAARSLRRVFEPFYREQDELTRDTRGSGIGLALVKELGDGMGAIVSAANASGGGLEVRIAFGAREAAEA